MFVTRKNESYRMINCKPGNDEYEFGFTYIQNLYNGSLAIFRIQDNNNDIMALPTASMENTNVISNYVDQKLYFFSYVENQFCSYDKLQGNNPTIFTILSKCFDSIIQNKRRRRILLS